MTEIIIAILSSSALSSIITALVTRKQTKVQVIDQMDKIYKDRIDFLETYIRNLEKKFNDKVEEIQKRTCVVEPCKKRITAE